MTEKNYDSPKQMSQSKPTAVADSPTVTPFDGMEVPKGAVKMDEVKAGVKPGEGSPYPGEPDRLFNPNNPLSPVTKPGNPSNPANPPNTQSDRSGDEQRQFLAQQQKDNPVEPSVEQKKMAEDRKKEIEELSKKLDASLKKYGSESAIPVGDEYFSNVARLRFLSNP